ncbi:MAG: hypothetical protein K2L13_01765, partial [Opitutales bacterium]|nr:hypothetical protein [Opitutales bacterium]
MPKIINFTKQIVDDPHFDAEIAIFASAFRHPTYEGLSKKENIGVFFFYKAGEPLEYVIVAKFKKNSPLKNDLIASGLRIKDIARWSFIARNADILDRLATQELVQITEKDLKSDFEVCPLLNRLSENLNVDTVNQILQLKDEKSIKQLRFVLHTIRDEIDELRKLTISAYLDDDETRLDVRIDAKPGSEIGEWFSADAGGTINIPQCTFKTAPLTSTFSRIDINSYRTFATRLWHKLLKNSDLTKVDIKIQRTIDDLDEFAKKANGQSAHYSFAGKDDEKDTLLLIFNGLFDDAYVKRVCCEVLPNIDSKWKCTLSTPLRYSDCNIFQANHSDKPTLYVCACKNNLVICNDEDTIKAAVDN